MTKRIELDAVDLKTVNCQLLIDKKNTISSFKLNEQEEKIFIELSGELKPGNYELVIEFEGILNDKLAGFYRSRYTDNGKEKYLATSQFEASDAKRAFPCIDNPAFKATFNVSMIIDKNLTAISNTRPRTTEAVVQRPWQGDKKYKKLVIFEKTPLMSTYLLYLGVG